MERKTRILMLLVIALGAFAPWANAADNELTLDLAAMTPNGVNTRPGGRNVTFNKITIINRIPRFHYSVDVALEEVGIRSLSLAGFGGRVTAQQNQEAVAKAVSCEDEIKDLIDQLDAVETEKAVQDIGAATKLAAPAVCKDPVWEAFVSLTQRSVEETVSVSSSQTLTVTASRPDVKFTLKLPGTARGEWRTSYGFFFVPDRDDRYFVKEEKSTTAGVASKFLITKDAGREEFDFVPTVVFTFFPNSAAQRSGIGGWTAGLGYDLEKPFVFGGYSWAYNENIIFTGGLTFHRQSRLLGKYHAKDDVGAQIESKQLVEDTYGPNVYAGISFRFGENIHEKREALLEATAKADEAAAAAREQAKKAEEESKLRKVLCTTRADSAEGVAKADCKEDAVCVAKAEKAAAVERANCAVTELDRIKAAREEKEKQEALEVAERRDACEKKVKAAHEKALSDCSKDLDDCKKNAANASAVEACKARETRCKTDAEVPFTTGNEDCLEK